MKLSLMLRVKLYPLYVLYMKMLGVSLHLPYHKEGQEASDLIKETLLKDEPCMICRFGGTELRAITTFLNIKELNTVQKILHLFRDESIFWSSKIKWMMQNYSGFFPPTPENLSHFAELMLNDSSYIDILCSWRCEESRLKKFFEQAVHIPLANLEPYRFDPPWTQALRGKKVLVIHPFVDTIIKQYAKREMLFEDQDVLPEFELKTLKAVQSVAGNKVEFDSWFDALDYMCNEIGKIDFDIALIGAGAYGFPLAAHVKRIGKKAVHMGGVSQLLFGIKGNRWDNSEYYKNLYNEYWTRPSQDETPPEQMKVEGGTYW